ALASGTQSLADFAAGLSYEVLPNDVVHQVKRILIDTLACVIGADDYTAPRIVDQVFGALGGTPEARQIPSGRRTNAAFAAYVNPELPNALDFADQFFFRGHFAAMSVAAPLAMAERVGADGRQLITAVATAFETSARVQLSFPREELVNGEGADA